MNIFRLEMKRNLRMFLVWTLPIIGYAVWIISMYKTSFAGIGLSDFMKAFPESFQKAFGMDRLSIMTPLGFFGIEVHVVVILFGAMFAALLSSSLLSKEEDEKTAEFLLAKPVTRSEVVLQKALVFISYTSVYVVAVWGASYLALKANAEAGFDEKAFWVLGGMTWLAVLVAASVGFLGSVFITRNRSVTSGSLGLILVFYAVQMVADISDKMKSLAYLTPFKWASAADILPSGTVRSAYLVAGLAVLAIALAGTFVAYGRKDIRA